MPKKSASPPKSRPKLKSLLIIDPDQRYTDSLRADPEFLKNPATIVEGGDAAVNAIEDESTRYGGIFISSTVVWPCALPLVKKAREHHPATPIYVTYKDIAPFGENELGRLAVRELVAKPVTFPDLLKRVLPGGVLPVLPSGLAPPPKPTDAETEEYIPVLLEEFLWESPQAFDTYVRVPTGKFLKIINAREVISRDRVIKYLETGNSYLYFRRESVQRCLSYCDVVSKSLLLNVAVPVEMKFLHTASLGRDLVDAFKSTTPIENFNVEYGFEFLGGLFSIVRQNQKDPSALIKTYLHNTDAIEHAVGVSFIAAMLSKPLNSDAPKLIKQLGFASLFHDVGLMQMDPKFADEDESQMSEPEKVEFRLHPEKGAQIVSEMEQIEAIAVQAVAQHHARRDSSGFPKSVKPGDIHVFAEIIGIADEFSRLLIKRKKDPKIPVFEIMEKQVFNGFSLKVVEAFRTIFMQGDITAEFKAS